MGSIKQGAAIGFIGTGVMGQSMVKNLMNAGYKLHVYSRTKSKTDQLVEAGAVWQETPGALAREVDVVITMVGFPSDVEEVYLGEQGILRHAQSGTYLIDMTTSSPSLAKKIEQEAKKVQCYSLDAPVSGGDVGAREARLSIMVGGEQDVFDAVLPVFEVMGKNIVYQGQAGAGQHTKMSNQIAIASNMMGVCEALIYSKKAGLDPSTVLKSIESGAAGSWSLSNLGPRIIKGDFEPGFFVKHFIKDMGIAIDSAEEMGLQTHGLKLAKSLYEQLQELGEENSGTQALYKIYE
ncbi:NAD(P)-dependent oxidoreductase [Paenibacillus sp. WQ 127069]|uniref:NAD(P)-dependent oxidoreductase n=1 Tax=Paenibacillus baimaensis TaxID=2982185 RepID=A0ABT2U8C9_9BACL|nr:NAD(P)-dependent oxidoreductase [Paenibacillus sp. WQ 127069]MCU6790878.1 NAD(P)-dependent oxidoreductase [Paenibacillus sp. WQ 127069]